MRQPKFRGFSNETKSWHYGHGWFEVDYTDEYLKEKGINQQAMLYTEGYPVECELTSMGEFTGVKDKQGIEVFEGDILKIDDDWENVGFASGEKGYVVFEKGSFKIKKGRIYVPRYRVDGAISKFSKIIGNVHENPDILDV